MWHAGPAAVSQYTLLPPWSDRRLFSAGFEARGFIFGPPIALALGVPFVPLRKPGKLPGVVLGLCSCSRVSAASRQGRGCSRETEGQLLAGWTHL